MSKRNHDEFLDRKTSEIAEEMVMDALIQETIQRIENETALLARQKRIAALYKKRASLREEYKFLKEEANSARAKQQLSEGEYMSWENGIRHSHAQVTSQNGKLASWREAVDDFVRKVSQLDAKETELKSVLKEIKSLKEEDTQNPTSGETQEPSTIGHD